MRAVRIAVLVLSTLACHSCGGGGGGCDPPCSGGQVCCDFQSGRRCVAPAECR